MRSVRCDAAARKTSEADECEYSSRKWCSTSQTVSKPDAVGDLDLLERVAEQPVLAVGAPGPRELVLVEDPEPHRRKARWPGRRGGRGFGDPATTS